MHLPLENAASHAAPVQYSLAETADLQPVSELLASQGLPHTDIAQHLQHCVIAKLGGAVVAVAGIEVSVPNALLRSVCVRESQQGRGVAARACELLEAYARNLGVTRFYLLTTTARAYFERQGFEVCSRAAAPEAIRATAEFRSLCPATAICMTRPLGAGALHLSAALLPLRPDVPALAAGR
jgi:amino-acid N-acetyltransferase